MDFLFGYFLLAISGIIQAYPEIDPCLITITRIETICIRELQKNGSMHPMSGSAWEPQQSPTSSIVPFVGTTYTFLLALIFAGEGCAEFKHTVIFTFWHTVGGVYTQKVMEQIKSLSKPQNATSSKANGTFKEIKSSQQHQRPATPDALADPIENLPARQCYNYPSNCVFAGS
jgi:hypothetical protein